MIRLYVWSVLQNIHNLVRRIFPKLVCCDFIKEGQGTGATFWTHFSWGFRSRKVSREDIQMIMIFAFNIILSSISSLSWRKAWRAFGTSMSNSLSWVHRQIQPIDPGLRQNEHRNSVVYNLVMVIWVHWAPRVPLTIWRRGRAGALGGEGEEIVEDIGVDEEELMIVRMNEPRSAVRSREFLRWELVVEGEELRVLLVWEGTSSYINKRAFPILSSSEAKIFSDEMNFSFTSK